MILTIVFSIITVIIWLIIIFDKNTKIGGRKIGGMVATLCAMFVIYMIFLGFIKSYMRDIPKYTTQEYRDIPIQSLINKSEFSVNGSFVLGCGGISGDESDYYVAYAQFPQGLLRVKIDSENTYVQESDESPKIINYYVRRVWLGYKSKWFWDSEPKAYDWTVNTLGEKIVVVPENTVYKDLYKIED